MPAVPAFFIDDNSKSSSIKLASGRSLVLSFSPHDCNREDSFHNLPLGCKNQSALPLLIISLDK
jgi:hypothetical protein